MAKALSTILTAITMFFVPGLIQAQTFSVTTPAEFQSALTQAQNNTQDDTINVAAGTYTVTETLSYTSEEGYALSVVGADATTTLLDGGSSRQCLSLENTGTGDISVSGLTCQNGLADTLGGGMSITTVDGATTISHCRLIDNVSSRSAGGAFIGGLNGTLTVDGCVVDGNSVDPATGDDGAGLDIYVDTDGTADIVLQNCTVTNNEIGECPTAVGSPDGAGVFMYHMGSGGTLTVRNNTISNNTDLGGPAGFYLRATVDCTLVFEGNTLSGNASGRSEVGASGGGAHIELEVADVTFSNNKFLNNRAIGPYAYGGGAYLVLETSGSCRIMNNVFAYNTSQQHGGGLQINMADGVAPATMGGNLFVGNQAGSEDGSGGGVMLNADCNPSLANNTFYYNSANDAGGLGYYTENPELTLTMANGIYRLNTPTALSNVGRGAINATYTNIEGGSSESWFGTGCIDEDPLFFNASNPAGADGAYATLDDGLHLTSGSPSMNTGSNATVPASLTADIAYQPRIQDDTVDMGAYEGVAGTTPLPECPDCGGDDVKISNKEYDGDTRCECTATGSITLGNGVKIRQGATMIFRIEP